ncbi:hypothetical protein [Shewanella psychrotolerans]|uniref:hypothetical protein n=1 Tax=Shewanella psychrotolerans TaxID=2864206 RepID=UPI001C660680|nr:hypothetical protein [Shewanella psychrotolerans]QYK03409.1 hypothetical protein K0I62_00200 [Shewanella psychrotolerans]
MDRLSLASVTLDINSSKNDIHYAMLISEDYDLNASFSSRLLINFISSIIPAPFS